MIINLVSDLHLDISGAQELPGGDVLILAGDICEAKELGKEFHSTKPLPYVRGKLPCYDFFEFELAKYKKVFYVLGNHEHYRGRYDKTRDFLKSMMPPNVTILENEVVEYEGVMFMGATLWTNFNNGDSITLYHMKHMMNDFKVIQNHYLETNLYHKLTPEYVYKQHIKTMQYFRLMLSMHRDKPFVVITHHAPSFASVHERFRGDFTMNGGYASDLSEDILDNENIKVWVHGHMHDPVDYKIGETRIIANPRGYLPYEGDNFIPGLYFEV
jgi:Icc-related predicted phosphoesterase